MDIHEEVEMDNRQQIDTIDWLPFTPDKAKT